MSAMVGVKERISTCVLRDELTTPLYIRRTALANRLVINNWLSNVNIFSSSTVLSMNTQILSFLGGPSTSNCLLSHRGRGPSLVYRTLGIPSGRFGSLLVNKHTANSLVRKIYPSGCSF